MVPTCCRGSAYHVKICLRQKSAAVCWHHSAARNAGCPSVSHLPLVLFPHPLVVQMLPHYLHAGFGMLSSATISSQEGLLIKISHLILIAASDNAYQRRSNPDQHQTVPHQILCRQLLPDGRPHAKVAVSCRDCLDLLARMCSETSIVAWTGSYRYLNFGVLLQHCLLHLRPPERFLCPNSLANHFQANPPGCRQSEGLSPLQQSHPRPL